MLAGAVLMSARVTALLFPDGKQIASCTCLSCGGTAVCPEMLPFISNACTLSCSNH